MRPRRAGAAVAEPSTTGVASTASISRKSYSSSPNRSCYTERFRSSAGACRARHAASPPAQRAQAFCRDVACNVSGGPYFLLRRGMPRLYENISGVTMKLLVIGAGMMGSAAAYDMARSPGVERVTLADSTERRAREAAARMNKLATGTKIRATKLDASKQRDARKLMRQHDAALSAVPYFFNLGLARAAVDAGCHFADLGGNNAVVREELKLARSAAKRGVALAPDCGLSPGMASILAGELMRRVG